MGIGVSDTGFSPIIYRAFNFPSRASGIICVAVSPGFGESGTAHAFSNFALVSGALTFWYPGYTFGRQPASDESLDIILSSQGVYPGRFSPNIACENCQVCSRIDILSAAGVLRYPHRVENSGFPRAAVKTGCPYDSLFVNAGYFFSIFGSIFFDRFLHFFKVLGFLFNKGCVMKTFFNDYMGDSADQGDIRARFKFSTVSAKRVIGTLEDQPYDLCPFL